jgi:uncharacterized protein YfaP (DUF2135 family)
MPQSTTIQQENKKTRFSSGSFARPFFFPSRKSSVLVTNKINNTKEDIKQKIVYIYIYIYIYEEGKYICKKHVSLFR